jgi:hypothetical protein
MESEEMATEETVTEEMPKKATERNDNDPLSGSSQIHIESIFGCGFCLSNFSTNSQANGYDPVAD